MCVRQAIFIVYDFKNMLKACHFIFAERKYVKVEQDGCQLKSI